MTTPVVVDEKFELDSPASSYRDEKKEFVTDGDDNSQVVVNDRIPVNKHLEEFHFTWRSAIVGSLLGCLVGRVFILYKYKYEVCIHSLFYSCVKHISRFKDWLDFWCLPFWCHFLICYH